MVTRQPAKVARSLLRSNCHTLLAKLTVLSRAPPAPEGQKQSTSSTEGARTKPPDNRAEDQKRSTSSTESAHTKPFPDYPPTPEPAVITHSPGRMTLNSFLVRSNLWVPIINMVVAILALIVIALQGKIYNEQKEIMNKQSEFMDKQTRLMEKLPCQRASVCWSCLGNGKIGNS